MKNIWWIASYPKSGNTWLRALLTSYLGNTAASINHLIGDSVTLRHAFDDWLGLESSDLRMDEIENYRHYYHLSISRDAEEPRFIKTHDAFIQTGEGKALHPEEATRGAIYLIRNPLDVAISYANHDHVSIDRIISAMNDKERCLLSHAERLRRTLPQRLLSWSLHTKGWLQCRNLKIVKYESLSDQPVRVFKEVLEHLDIPSDEQRIKNAIKNSSFQNLQKQEADHGFKERHAPAQSFFRSGKVGEWKKTLTPRQIDTIMSHHKDMMTYFNYP